MVRLFQFIFFILCLLGSSAESSLFTIVNGAPKPYSQVTEDDHELMTPEEYTAFFNILQARS